MPVSSSVHISDCLDHIIRLQPKSVLDIGCGFGLWGFLCREYLDVWNERVQPEQWQVRIDGVELWEPYIQSHQRSLYNNIILGDVREVADSLGEYDLIIAGDVIEHLDKPEGELVIEQLYDRAKLALLVNIPLSGNWDHPENYGNPGELHRSQWSPDDFAPYAPKYRGYELPCGQYGSFFCTKDLAVESRLAGLLDAAGRREAAGDISGAARALASAQALAPNDATIPLHRADVLLTLGDLSGAVEALRGGLIVHPYQPFMRLSLARLLLAQRDSAAATREVQWLLSAGELPEELRAQTEALAAQLMG